MKDEFNLQRFVDAQEKVYETVRDELTQGCKRSHWMWFVFPQLQGLGSSPTAIHYGISGLEEARAYLSYPLLGERLRECTGLLMSLSGRSLDDIFGYPDNLKFHSSITLFSIASDDEELFDDALGKYFAGQHDPQTVRLLQDAI